MPTFDESAFVAYMKTRKKSARTQANYLEHLRGFGGYLAMQGKTIDAATPDDVHGFMAWVKAGGKATQHLDKARWGLWTYAEYVDDEALFLAAIEHISADTCETTAIKAMTDIDPEFIAALKAQGICTVDDLLGAAGTGGDRERLSEATDVPFEVLLQMVQYADLLRLPGTKFLRVTLIDAAGFHCLADIAALDDPAVFLAAVNAQIAAAPDAKLALGAKEGRVTLLIAKHLPQRVSWDD